MDAAGVPTDSWTHRALRWVPHDGAGLCGAALLWLSGLAPSLLPRPTVVAVALAGLLAALGYGVGCLIGWGARAAFARGPRIVSRWLYAVAAVVWAIALVMTVIAAEWQREQLAALGMTTPAPAWWTVLIGGLLLAWALVALGRGLRALARKVSARLLPRMGGFWSSVVGVLSAVAAIAAVVVAGYGATWFMFDRIDRAGSGQAAPTSAVRSGGPGSLVPFASLGAEGQSFVTGGPSTDAIAQQSARPVVEPVRVYVGLASAPDVQARAQLAVQELRRTGAFQRRLVVVATSTGNGFLDPDLVDTPEVLEDGDVATVSMQYSVLPSWLSFLVDQGAAEEAATALFTAVKGAIDELPAGERPKLAVSGESLGAFGSQARFAGMDPAQVAEQVDYAVWVGTPGATELWSTWRDDRSAGPEWQPAVGDGTIARNPATADSPVWSEPGWGPRRIVLTQHANDPVSWWSPNLLLSRPDWLSEPRGPGVDARMTWWPVVLFLQTGLDLAAAGSVPPGVGHDYGDVTAQAWAYALAE